MQSERPRGTQQESEGNNIFSGFDAESLAESFKIPIELARKLQGERDQRGVMVQLGERLEVVSGAVMEESVERDNGIAETICSMSLRHNIGDPSRADIHNPHGGYITSANSLNLPILRDIQLSAERGVLYQVWKQHFWINYMRKKNPINSLVL